MFSLLLGIIYLAFISLGLPDALLGSAWPSMYLEFGVPVSYMGILSVIISLGTVVSSLQTDRLARRLGTGRVTALSVALTAAALFGFSVTHSFWLLCLWAVPYGLGAGCVDAALNNFVALHYESRHMSWLHCMWGLGATVGPYFMSLALTRGAGWSGGYRYISLLQLGLTAVLMGSLPLWKRCGRAEEPGKTPQLESQALSLREIFRISGTREVFLCFFCYCALEQSAGQWASSYLTLCRGVAPETAARFASLFYIGITVGRAFCGFLSIRMRDDALIRLGQTVLGIGVLSMALPGPQLLALAGFLLVGLGCAPIYPCIIHSTPARFGVERSQAIIGVQMACAYVGNCVMPPLFGVLADLFSAALLPFYLLLILLLMVWMHRELIRKTKKRKR